MSSQYREYDIRRARAREVRTRAITTDLRTRQARRKALKPLLRDLLVRDPYNLPAELLPHILTWVGYDLIHNFSGEYYYQTDQLWDPDPGRPLPDPGRRRPVRSTRNRALVRVGTELRFELIARPERESDSESETIDPANQFSILGTN